MSLFNVYKRIALTSPYIEVLMRQIYWRNISFFEKFRPKKTVQKNNAVVEDSNKAKADFDSIITFLQQNGVKEGDVIIVHSSYEELEKTDLLPEEIINKLLLLVGESGTLAMPAIRKFKNTPQYKDLLKQEFDEVRTYDTQKSRVTSGLLPYTMLKRKDSFVSRFPLNPMVAIGRYAETMMEKNLEGDLPSAHGANSSWKFCLDKNAWVIGLGVNLAMCNTITHVAEEAFEDWLDKDWYKTSKFIIKDGDFEIEKEIKERKLEKALLHYAEFNLNKDILRNGILVEDEIEGIRVGILSSQQYISFLRSHKNSTYPYFKW